MSTVVSTSITDLFVLRDNSNVAITGKTSADFTTVEAYQIGAAGTTAAVTLTEIGSGEYRISFTPSTPTTGEDLEWTSHVLYNSGGVFREFLETYQVTYAASTTVTVSTASAGAQLITRAELRDEVADQFEDLVIATATANGNVGKTTILDTYHVNGGQVHFNGCDLLCTSGTNNGLLRTVIGTDKTTGTLTLNAALTVATATSDTFKLYNRSGRGFAKEQYDREINYAIRNAFPTGMINVVATISGAFDANVPEITVPASIVDVYALEVEDSNGFWHDIPKAGQAGGSGWFADQAAGQLRLHGQNAWFANTLSLRVHGLGRQAELTADSDTCALSNKFIVAHACYRLATAGVANEQNSVRVNLFRDEMERYRVTLRRNPGPYRTKVRAA